jgi:hypothetical protein
MILTRRFAMVSVYLAVSGGCVGFVQSMARRYMEGKGLVEMTPEVFPGLDVAES